MSCYQFRRCIRWPFYFLVLFLILPVTFASQPSSAQSLDLIMVEKGHEWLFPSVAAIVSQTGHFPLPGLLAVSRSIKRNTTRLIRQVLDKKGILLKVSNDLEFRHLNNLNIESLRLSPHPTRSGILLARHFWKQSDTVIIASSADIPAMIHGAALATHRKIPFIPTEYITKGMDEVQINDFKMCLDNLKCKKLLIAASDASKINASISSLRPECQIFELSALQDLILKEIGPKNVKNIILANVDSNNYRANPAWLAPYLSVMRKSPIILSSSTQAQAAEAKVMQFIREYQLSPRSITIMGDYDFIGTLNVSDDSLLKGYQVEVEPCSLPPDGYASSMVVGRLPFKSLEDTSIFLLRNFAREYLLKKTKSDRKVLLIAIPRVTMENCL